MAHDDANDLATFRWDQTELGRQMQVVYVKIAFYDRARRL